MARAVTVWELVSLTAKWIAADKDHWSLELTPERSRDANEKDLAEGIIDFFLSACWSKGEPRKGNARKKYWLRELVDSALDADRLDYLQRDTHAFTLGHRG